MSIEIIHGKMHEFVPREYDELWEEWTKSEQLEACIAFAMAFEQVGAMAIDWQSNEVRFMQKPHT